MSATAIDGTDAAEWISGDENDNTIRAFGGDDAIHAPLGHNTIDGGDGTDTLIAYEGPEEINVVRADGSSNPNLGWPYYEGGNPTIHATPPTHWNI